MTDISVVKGDLLVTSSVAVGHPTTHVYDNDNLNVIDLSGSLILRGSGSAPLSPLGAGTIVYDSALQKIRVSENGGTYSNLVGSVGGGITSSAGINIGSGQGVYAGNADLGTLQFRTLLAGTGLGFVSGSQTLMLSYTGSTSGAPTDAPYVVLAANPSLTNNRVLTGTVNRITITDNGAGSSIVLSIPQDINTFSSPTFGNLNIGSVITASHLTFNALPLNSIHSVNTTQDNQQVQIIAGSDFTQGAGWQMAGRNAPNSPTNKGSILGNIGNIDGTNFFAIQNNNFSGTTSTLLYINGGSQNTYLAPQGGKVIIGVNQFVGITPNSMLDVSGGITFRQLFSAPALSPANTSLIYFDQSSQKLKVSQNGSAYQNLVQPPSGLSGSVQFNSVSTFSGSARVFIENTGNLLLKDNTFEPIVPTSVSGTVVYAKYRGGRRLLAVNDNSRWDTSFQPFLATNKVCYWTAWGNSLSTSSLGFNSITTGTLAQRNFATTNFFTSVRRQGFNTTANIGAIAGTTHGIQQFWTGNANFLGGFQYIVRFGIGTGSQGGIRLFVGMQASTTFPATGLQPSSLSNVLGFGLDSGDNTFSFLNADGVSKIKTNLGSSFPASAPYSTDIYEARLYAPPNGTTIYYMLERLNTGDLIEGSVISAIPSNTTALSPICWIGTTSGSVTGLDIVSQYLETDN